MTEQAPVTQAARDAAFLRDVASRIFKHVTPAQGFDQGDTDQLYALASRLDSPQQGEIELVTSAAKAIALSRFKRQMPWVPAEKIKGIIPDALDIEDAEAAIFALSTPTPPTEARDEAGEVDDTPAIALLDEIQSMLIPPGNVWTFKEPEWQREAVAKIAAFLESYDANPHPAKQPTEADVERVTQAIADTQHGAPFNGLEWPEAWDHFETLSRAAIAALTHQPAEWHSAWEPDAPKEKPKC